MNSKGKEQIPRKRVKSIKIMLKEEKKDPIMKKDKEDLGVNTEGAEVETSTMKIETSQTDAISGTGSSTRQKKAPKSLSTDFLW